MNQPPFGSKLCSLYDPIVTGGLKAYFAGFGCFSKMCFGMIHMAFQRTVKSAWKREFGFFSLKTTVYLSGAEMLSTLTDTAM